MNKWLTDWQTECLKIDTLDDLLTDSLMAELMIGWPWETMKICYRMNERMEKSHTIVSENCCENKIHISCLAD